MSQDKTADKPAAEQPAAPAARGGWGKWALIGLAVMGALWLMGVRNNLATSRQDVLAQFGQVQNVMQRRTDVLTNVANAALAGAKNERGALTDIAEARAKATSANNLMQGMDLSKMLQDKDLQEQFFKAMAAQQQAMLKLTSVVEAYPEIKATPLFAQLQYEIAGSENRVSIERMRSQGLIKAYNNKVVVFPGNIAAKIFGYPEMAYFEATPTSQQAPDLSKTLKLD
jgi:LemA protein